MRGSVGVVDGDEGFLGDAGKLMECVRLYPNSLWCRKEREAVGNGFVAV